MTIDMRSRIEGYVAMVNRLNEPEGGIVEAEYGRRYAKIISNHHGHRSVHTFIDLTNGDILKAGTWKQPQKNGVRGSVLADDFGESVVDKYGAKYLR